MKKISVILVFLLIAQVMIPFQKARANNDPDFKLEGVSWANGEAIVSTFNVKDFGAIGDGVHDDTRAIRDALDRCLLYGCGIVFFPEGKYRVTENLTISAKNTVLRGMWKSPEDGGSGKGSIIMVDMSPEEAGDSPFVTVGADGCTIMELSFWYPRQSFKNVKPYSWTISTGKGAVHGTTVKRVTLYNSYKGIALYNSAVHAREIYGTILNTGIVLDYNLEVSDVTQVRFGNDIWIRSTLKNSPKTEAEQKMLYQYTSTNATGLELGRIDDIWVYDVDINSFDFRTGIRTYKSTDMSKDVNGGPYGHIMNTGNTSIQIDGVTGYYPQNPDLLLDFVDKVKGSENFRYSFNSNRKSVKQKLYVVTDYGAVGNGKNDDTKAIQSALDSAGKSGGGIVLLPKGKFRVNGSLTVPSNVEFRGFFESEHNLQTLSVSAILAYNGKNKPNAEALITLKEKAGIHGITIYYPESSEDFKNTGKVASYPWSIEGSGNNIWIEYVVLMNSWNGINLSKVKCDSFTLKGVWGSCAGTGLKVGSSSSSGRIENLFFSYALWFGMPGYSPYIESEKKNAEAIKKYFTDNAVGYVFDKCSNIQIFSGAVFGLQNGMIFNKGAENFTIYRALLDQPGKTKCLVLNGGNNINILGMSNGTHNAGIIAGSGFKGKVRIYGRNSWGRGKDTESYDQNTKGKDIVVYENPNPGIDKLHELDVPTGINSSESNIAQAATVASAIAVVPVQRDLNNNALLIVLLGVVVALTAGIIIAAVYRKKRPFSEKS